MSDITRLSSNYFVVPCFHMLRSTGDGLNASDLKRFIVSVQEARYLSPGYQDEEREHYLFGSPHQVPTWVVLFKHSLLSLANDGTHIRSSWRKSVNPSTGVPGWSSEAATIREPEPDRSRGLGSHRCRRRNSETRSWTSPCETGSRCRSRKPSFLTSDPGRRASTSSRRWRRASVGREPRKELHREFWELPIGFQKLNAESWELNIEFWVLDISNTRLILNCKVAVLFQCLRPIFCFVIRKPYIDGDRTFPDDAFYSKSFDITDRKDNSKRALLCFNTIREWGLVWHFILLDWSWSKKLNNEATSLWQFVSLFHFDFGEKNKS